nr:glycosyltransferase [Acidobacteriota bacterium]
ALDIQLPGVRETRAVYVGSFDDRFGSDALSAAALRLPDINFILIGPGSDRAAMTIELSNITSLGPVAYAKLPAILAQCSVGLLPLSRHAANAGRSPMKLYEYAAAGLTVAATNTPELSRRALSTLSLSEDDLGYEAAVRRAFRQAADTALVELGRQEAARESWASKTTHLLDILQASRPYGLPAHEQSHGYITDPRSL